MNAAVNHDRLGQLLMSTDDGLLFDDARYRLERSAILLTYDPDVAESDWGQAALQAIARCGSRMFRGGVFLGSVDATSYVRRGWGAGLPLGHVLQQLGCRQSGVPHEPFHIHVGRTATKPADIYCTAEGWVAIATPEAPLAKGTGNAISGATAGALAISEAFRRKVMGDILACRRPQRLSLWNPAHPETGGALNKLPASIWILGAGNLGQALLFLMTMLPYADVAKASLLIQDSDISGSENLDTQLLTDHDWIGVKKSHSAARVMRSAGFNVTACERRFGPQTRIESGEPRIALVGVDNLMARRHAATAGFDLVIDAGLGKTAAEIFDVRLHSFPGGQEVETVWPEHLDYLQEPVQINKGLQNLLDEGRLDQCGAITLAGQSLGVPSTALVAAALQLGQLCRALSTGAHCDFIDVSLGNCDRVASHDSTTASHLPALSVTS